jgi:antitoxin component YwqK of YwqJK toxin-antitoxin module
MNTIIDYHEFGIEIKTIKNNLLDGKYLIQHYNNNKKIVECNYKNGQLDGEYKIYDNNGNIISHKFYKKNVLLYDDYEKYLSCLTNNTKK